MTRARSNDAPRNEICVRTKWARENAKIKHDDMAGFLGIDSGRYNKYETRTPIRQEFMAKFCDLTGVSEKWLLTGKGPVIADNEADLAELRKIYLGINQEAREKFLALGRVLEKLSEDQN